MTDQATIHVRNATSSDAARICEIYDPYVQSSNATFELETPTVDEMNRRVEQSQTNWHWLVAEVDGLVVGYAYAGAHRGRPAYRYSAETSIYLDPNWSGKGIGGSLYGQLITLLTGSGYANAYAGITLPNAASVHLHRRLGFEFIGVFPRVGWKFERWHDVAWWHLPLADRPTED